MHTSQRSGGAGAVEKIVLHLNAGPEVEGGARGLSSYLDHIDAGYHEICDDREFIIKANADQIVWGAAGMNDHGYHICGIGLPQSPQEWNDAYSFAEQKIWATRVAQKCHDLNIPPTHLSDSQVGTPGVRGVCDHFSVNRAIVKPANARGDHSMGPGDHVDCGSLFPFDSFMAMVNVFYGGNQPTPIPQVQEDEPMAIICTRVNSTVPGREAWVDFDPASKTLFAFNGPTFATGADPTVWKVTVWPKNDTGLTGTAQLLLATKGKLRYGELPAKNGAVITADGDGGTFGIGYHQLDK